MKGYRKPHRFKRKKPIFRNKFFWSGILIFVLISFLFYFLFFSSVLQVKKVILSGEKRASTENLKELVENKLENKVLFIRTKSIFAVNLGEIRRDILNNFPQIAQVEISRGLPDALNILVVERLEVADWCWEEKCFLLDNQGIIFGDFSTEKDLIKIRDERDFGGFLLGEQVIEKEDLSKILTIQDQLKSDFKISLKEFLLDEEKLTVLVEDSWEIYFNLQSDIDWQLTKLKAVLEEKIPPEKRKDLEYIELRFGNFAPYKYKD